jgi:hypothetical protein
MVFSLVVFPIDDFDELIQLIPIHTEAILEISTHHAAVRAVVMVPAETIEVDVDVSSDLLQESHGATTGQAVHP